MIHNLADSEGTTILLTTHDLAEAEKLADRILILAVGRIVADGSADALASQIEAKTQVRWNQGGVAQVHPAADATGFVRTLLRENPTGISHLEVRRASLEDTYIEMVQKHESGYHTEGIDGFRGGLPMNRNLHAMRVGLHRGRTEMILSLKSAQDQSFYLIMALASLGYLYVRRNTVVEGTDLSFPTLAMPSLLGSLIVFGLVMGPAGQLAMDREDGTLLRAKAAPGGMLGYVTSQIVLHSGSLLPTLLVILVPGSLLFDGLMPAGARRVAPPRVGAARSAFSRPCPSASSSGRSFPAFRRSSIVGTSCPSSSSRASRGSSTRSRRCGAGSRASPRCSRCTGWASGMRSAFLPDEAATLELGESWRTAADRSACSGRGRSSGS